jgi:hypothetical protein
VLHASGEQKKAEKLYREALAAAKKHYGERDAVVPMILSNLSELDVADANELLDEAADILDDFDEDEDPPSAKGMLPIGLCPEPR